MNIKQPNKKFLFEESSLIKGAEYDPFMNVLTLTFHNGRVYEFIEVPEKLYKQLTEAKSPGKFFHGNIKGKFEFLKTKNLQRNPLMPKLANSGSLSGSKKPKTR